MYVFVYDSTKHAWVYKTYIYIKDAPDINMLTNVLVVCILLNQIPAPQMMNPDDFLQTQNQMSNYTDIIW